MMLAVARDPTGRYGALFNLISFFRLVLAGVNIFVRFPEALRPETGP